MRPPWANRDILAGVLSAWRVRFADRDLFRVAAGPGWVHLQLTGNDRPGLLLCDVPGARLVLHHPGRLPAPLATALPAAPRHPLVVLLAGARLEGCGLLPDDRVAAFRLRRPGGDAVVLLHRLFGARGNTTLIDNGANLLWSVHRPPHPALATWPPDATWTAAGPAAPADYDATALTVLARACTGRLAGRLGSALDRRLKSADRLAVNLARDLAAADRGDLYRRKAEALAARLHTLSQGEERVVLPDLTDDTPLEITLDPSQTPAANMEAWFRRARKARKGLQIIRERHAAAVAELQSLHEAHAELDALVTADPEGDDLARLATLQQWEADHGDLLPRPAARPRGHGPEEAVRPFRRFLIDGKWEVWIGRSNTENDELTHRAAHNRDIWLHAQGVAGSHVILRTAGHPERVPRTVLFKAAALAALHSKARHAQLVPVIHTEKRYVRKPRKSPPGTAVCLRDHSLFAEPGVVDGVEPI